MRRWGGTGPCLICCGRILPDAFGVNVLAVA